MKNFFSNVRSGGEKSGSDLLKYSLFLGAAMTLAISTSPATAGIFFTGGTGYTVYGVTDYGGGGVANPSYIANVNTGFADILSSPGGGFQTANPVIANNIAQYGFYNTPYGSFQIGGGNANGPFGSGSVFNSGVFGSFSLTDATHGCCSASYSITSWIINLQVDAAGFVGDVGTWLSIAGVLPVAGDSAVAALTSHYYVNGALQGTSFPLILAASRDPITGLPGNTVALGGFAAGLQYGNGGTTFQGLAVDSVAAVLAPFSTLQVLSTLTVYADPSSLQGVAPDLSLLPAGRQYLPTTLTGVGAVPEPMTWAMMVVGFAAIGSALRRKALKVAFAA